MSTSVLKIPDVDPSTKLSVILDTTTDIKETTTTLTVDESNIHVDDQELLSLQLKIQESKV